MEEDIQKYSPTVMFRGTLCMFGGKERPLITYVAEVNVIPKIFF